MKFEVWFKDGTAAIRTLQSQFSPNRAERYFKGKAFRIEHQLLPEIVHEVTRKEPDAG